MLRVNNTINASNLVFQENWNRKQRDLGVQIDEKLKFGVHIYEKVNKAYSMLGMIKRNFKYMDKETFVNLYKAFGINKKSSRIYINCLVTSCYI